MRKVLSAAENKPAKPVPLAEIEALAEIERFGPAAREVVLAHFGGSIEEIESILGKSASDWSDDLAWVLWKYARGKAGQDNSLPERSSGLRRYLEPLDKTARQLRGMLAKGRYAEDAAASTAAVMLGAAGLDVGQLLKQLDVVLSVTGNFDWDFDKREGGRPPDVEYGLLITRVIYIFQQATGRQPTLTYDPIHHVHDGAFFRFAELVDEAAAEATLDQPRSNSALGSWLRRMLSAQDPVQNPRKFGGVMPIR
jgi:hypothetical protein